MIFNCDKITPRKIKKFLSSSVGEIIYFPKTDSTNARAKQYKNPCDFSIFVADLQTSGRGRMGRSWYSKKGKGIFMSLLLKPKISSCDVSGLTLVAGLGVLRALKSFGMDAKIKWPNDIVINSKKVSGILAESFTKDDDFFVVVGIGINVLNKNFSKELKEIATSILMEKGEKILRAKIIAKVMDEIKTLYDEFLKSGLDSMIAEYKKNCITLGKRVLVKSENGDFLAQAIDITKSGELLVKKDDIEIKVLSGEVSVRGIYGYV